MRKPARAIAFATGLLFSQPLAADDMDAQITDEIARAPGVTLGDLLPAALNEAVENPVDKRPSDVRNADGEPFEVTFEIPSPDHGWTILTFFVSEREFATRTIGQIFDWAAGGIAPAGLELDSAYPEGFDCIGDVGNKLISCRFGSAGVQFSATSLTDDDGMSYEDLKDMLLTLPVDTYATLFGV